MEIKTKLDDYDNLHLTLKVDFEERKELNDMMTDDPREVEELFLEELNDSYWLPPCDIAMTSCTILVSATFDDPSDYDKYPDCVWINKTDNTFWWVKELLETGKCVFTSVLNL